MDTSSFFIYPTDPQPAQASAAPVAGPPPQTFLADLGEEDWNRLLEHTTTIRFAPDATVFSAGDQDRAFYLMVAGRVEVVGAEGDTIEAPATLGEAAFFDGLPRAVTVRAIGHGEALRLSYDAFEALSARHPRIAQALLLDLGRVGAARQRSALGSLRGFTG